MRNPKSGLAFSAAALFCVIAVITRIAGSPTFIPILAIIVAAIALFVALNNRVAAKLIDQPVTFSPEQIEQLKELKSRDQEAAAIRQAQLWSRGSSSKAVAEAVRKL